MPIYEFRCNDCAHDYELYQDLHAEHSFRCPECHTTTKRVYVPFKFNADVLPEHFNPAAGRMISSETEFKRALKEQSITESIRQGKDVNIVPVDLNDTKTLGVTEEGLAATYNQQIKDGKREKKRIYG